MKKNNTAEKVALDAQKISKAIKENTENSLLSLMNEAINNLMQEDDEEENEDSYEVEDVDTETPEVSAEEPEMGGEEDVEGDEPEADDANEWADMDDYKVGDDDYDFTGVDGDELLKVYDKLGDNDQIFVKKEDDGTYTLEDGETDAEYVIELDPEATEDADMDADSEEDADIELDFGDEDAEGEDDSLDIDVEGGEDFDAADGEDDSLDIEIEDDDEDELNEDKNEFTDSYQKDVFAKKFNMNEPADSKTTYDMDGGAPKGSEKPWAGKGDMKPFEKSVNECGDMPVDGGMDANLEENGSGENAKRHMAKGNTPINKPGEGYHEESKAKMDESIKKIIAKAKQIQEQNKQYEAQIGNIKKSLAEAAVSNVTLANLVRLLSECTLTVDERKNMIHRFDNVTTLKESKAIYESVKRELSESKKSSAPIVERQMAAQPANQIIETVIYQTPANNASLNLMERMENLFKPIR